MTDLLEKPLYLEDINIAASAPVGWDAFQDRSILIAGATGMIGSCMIDVLMHKNRQGLNCRIYAIGRSVEKAKRRFGRYWESPEFHFVEADVNQGIPEHIGAVDYVLHAASNTHPVAYATEPIATITTNVIGTDNLLRYAARNGVKRFIFASSVEVYGENRGDCDAFCEDYCGYIDCNTLRAGYPESKRVGEALCQAYIREKDLDVVVARLARIYGPTMLMSDTKALSQFIKKGISRENIVLKSEGTQYFSYCYVVDAVCALLFLFSQGENGTAYNIADQKSDITLRDLAQIIAGYAGTEVVFEIPDAVESAGYSKATRAILDSTRLKRLGWNAMYDIKAGLERTIGILSDSVLNGNENG